MSVGDKEVDRDDVVSFGRIYLEGKTRGYEFVPQEGGGMMIRIVTFSWGRRGRVRWMG